MRSTKVVNKVILIGSLSVAMIALFGITQTQKLYSSLFPSRFLVSAPVIGEMIASKKSVRGKGRGRLIWEDKKTGSAIKDGDTFFTGKGSTATLKLSTGQTITLEQNTLIEIKLNQKQASLNLKLGGLSGELVFSNSFTVYDEANGSQKILRGENGTTFKLNKDANGKLKIDSKSLGFQLTTTFPNPGNRLKKFKPGRFSQQDKKSLESAFQPLTSVKTKLIKPSPEALVEPSVPTRFSWTSVYRAKAFEVEVSQQESFKPLTIKQTQAKGTHFTARGLAPGLYYWRARAQFDNAFGPWSDEKIFFVGTQFPDDPMLLAKLAPNAPAAPKIVSSLRNRGYKYTRQQISEIKQNQNIANSPKLAWSKNNLVKKYTLEISTTSNFSELFRTIETANNEAYWTSIEPGVFYWRIQPHGFNKKVGKYSSISKIQISLIKEKRKAKTTPVIVAAPLDKSRRPATVSPSDGANIVSVGGQQENILLVWNKVKSVIGYEVEVSPSANFAEVYSTYTTRKPAFVVKDSLLTGKNYWRVRGFNETSKTPWSETKHFVIKDFYKKDQQPFRPSNSDNE